MKKRITILWVVFVGLLMLFVWMLTRPSTAQAMKPEVSSVQPITLLSEPNPITIELVDEDTIEGRLNKAGLNGGFATFAPKATDLPEEN